MAYTEEMGIGYHNKPLYSYNHHMMMQQLSQNQMMSRPSNTCTTPAIDNTHINNSGA